MLASSFYLLFFPQPFSFHNRKSSLSSQPAFCSSSPPSPPFAPLTLPSPGSVSELISPQTALLTLHGDVLPHLEVFKVPRCHVSRSNVGLLANPNGFLQHSSPSPVRAQNSNTHESTPSHFTSHTKRFWGYWLGKKTAS